MSTIPQSTCSLIDNACICSNANLTAAISGCLAQTCTVIEMLREESTFSICTAMTKFVNNN